MSNLPAMNKVQTIRDLLNKSKKQIAMALPKHLSPEKMLRVAMTSIQQNYLLLECDPKSLIGAIMEASQLGLLPDGVLGHAYLIPYWNSKKKIYEAQLQIGYRGFLELAYRSQRITKIYAQVVYEGEKYEVELGLHPKLVHIPSPPNGESRDIVATYAVVYFKDAEPDFEWLWKEEIEKVRKISKAADNGPWVTHYEEMAKKTAIRRLAKRLPLSTELQRAAVMDEYTELGVKPEKAEIDIDFVDVKEKSEEKVKELKKKLRKAKKEKQQEETPPPPEPIAPSEFLKKAQEYKKILGEETFHQVYKVRGFNSLEEIPPDRVEEILTAWENFKKAKESQAQGGLFDGKEG